jgi:hypothetical protein
MRRPDITQSARRVSLSEHRAIRLLKRIASFVLDQAELTPDLGRIESLREREQDAIKIVAAHICVLAQRSHLRQRAA